MKKRVVLILACCLALLSVAPSTGRCSHYCGGAALAWGLGGFFLGSALSAAVYRPVVYAVPPPVVYQPVYVRPVPPQRVYSYAPSVPAGMCRWERSVLDGYGRAILDGYGRPVKEYTLGDCRYPPN